ncbi:unnamed protein product [Fusarium venenatum]|uniref:Protein kinase domain-containing protein n=1 Tax=Fusarium venenatum TaxID=56646 RepID=A0A2L2TFP5_9HYPO|nr:uncharacterized protein FVRRES_07673 [Fusarium venenatum]CEI63237.1 unnamed protein product [Fusarium venenatum]
MINNSTMIDEDSKYFCLSGDIRVCGGPSTWHVVDWDRRRVVSVTMDGEQDDGSLLIEFYSRLNHQISSETYRIYVSESGEIISTHFGANDDMNYCIHYPSAQKYAKASWKEMNLWIRLPRHPNIVPFDCVVIDEIEGGVVGITSVYVPGNSLEDNKSRVFKLKWLLQLIGVVDELNLVCDISHQDIAPRHIVVNETTDCIVLFNFNFTTRISHPPEEGEAYVEARNDVKGVCPKYASRRPNLDSLASEWIKHPDVMLDHPVESYQILLKEWQKRRTGHVSPLKDARHISWPSMPKPPQKSVLVRKVNGESFNVMMDNFFEKRQDAWARVEEVVRWDRPPQRGLESGTRVLCTGDIIA